MAMAPIISGTGGMREYRKGNWTLQETMILIEAKRMDDERRLKRSTTTTLTEQQQQQLTSTSTPGSSQQQETMVKMMRSTTTTPQSSKAIGELRWKWVEDYCWRRGCFRSQNQCNDKWDNLMRDYKKVRDHQRNLILSNGNAPTQAQQQHQPQSYWNMEKSERKGRGLPSNMLPTIYDALVQVVEKKSSSSPSPAPSPALLLPPPPLATTISSADVQTPKPTTSGALSLLLKQQQHMNVAAAASALPLPPPLPFPSQLILYQPTTTIPGDHSLLYSDTSSDTPAKRRRTEKRPAAGAGAGKAEPSSSTADSSIASALCKISEAMQESERRQDERHREMIILKQRRVHIEESRMVVNRQGMNGLVEAINNLANSILALSEAAANNTNNKNGQTPPPQPPG